MIEQNLLRYLEGILQLELDLFVQRNTIAALTKQYNALGIQKNIYRPRLEKAQVSLANCMISAGIICGIIVGIVGLILEWRQATGFFYYIAALIAALLLAAGGFLTGAVVFGLLSWFVLRIHRNKALAQKHQKDIAAYETAISKQESRIKQENTKKVSLKKEIAALHSCYQQTQNYLDEVYCYNVIDPDYRNIYAISSFCGYLRKGRTHCLHFNQLTGDQGAYNIYENERRLDIIITNTDEILRNLEIVSQNQYELAVGLRNATRQFKMLCGNVTKQLENISDSVTSIERCQSVIAYHTECNTRNLNFLTWVHTMY